MEQSEEHEWLSRSKVTYGNIYCDKVNNVINLNLNDIQMKGIYEDIRQMLGGDKDERSGTTQIFFDNHGNVNNL